MSDSEHVKLRRGLLPLVKVTSNGLIISRVLPVRLIYAVIICCSSETEELRMLLMLFSHASLILTYFSPSFLNFTVVFLLLTAQTAGIASFKFREEVTSKLRPEPDPEPSEMSTADVYDCIVIGAGVQGSFTAYELAKRGKKTVLLEQVRPAPKSGHLEPVSLKSRKILRLLLLFNANQ